MHFVQSPHKLKFCLSLISPTPLDWTHELVTIGPNHGELGLKM